MSSSSFYSQRLHRIDAGGAERRYETSQRGYAADEQGYAAIEPWVARAHFEKQSLHEARNGEGKTEADHEPDHRKPQSFSHHQADDIARGRAERETDAEFIR